MATHLRTELAADAWLVDYTRTLDYSIGGGPMLWRSPIWMPLAWEVVTVQFGYVGLRLWERSWRPRATPDRRVGGDQHPLLRGNGAQDLLVGIQRVPNGFKALLIHANETPLP